MPNEILDAALGYLKMGFSIIPFERGGKRPLVNWEEFQKRRMTEDEVRRYFSGDVNIGVVCGAISGNLVVVDWDDKAIYERVKKLEEIPTLTHESGRGIHKFFRTAKPVPCFRISELSIDVKGEGGCVVMPPSLHKNGKTYRRISETDMPRLLETQDFKQDFISSLENELKITLEKQKDIVRISDILSGVGEGKRDISAIQLATWYRMKGLAFEDVLVGLKAWNTKNRPPLSEKDLRGKVESAFKPLEPYRYRFDEPPERQDQSWMEDILKVCSNKEIRNKTGRLAEMLRQWVLSKPDMIFATLRDTDELLHYEDGVYAKFGEKVVAEWVEAMMNNARCGAYTSSHLVSEVVNSVKRNSYVDREIFDERPELICMENGIFNIESKEFFEHTPDYRFLVKIPVTYDAKQECPVFDRFVEDILPEQKDRDALVEFTGYCLYRSLPFHKSFMLVGSGSNGKSTFLGVLKNLLGDRNVSCVGLQELEGNFALAALYGKLANIYPDLSSKAMKSTGKFKALTGGDSLTTDVKFREHMTVSFTLKMIFSCNEIPNVISDDTAAYFRRWCILTFPKQYTEDTADPDLPKKLTTKEELSGVFNKAIAALGRLMKNRKFSNDCGIAAARDRYIRSSDPIRAFVMDEIEDDENGRLAIDSEGSIPKNALYAIYREYCKGRGYMVKTDDIFFKILKTHAHVETVRITIDEKRVWSLQGLRLKGEIPQPKVSDDEQTTFEIMGNSAPFNLSED